MTERAISPGDQADKSSLGSRILIIAAAGLILIWAGWLTRAVLELQRREIATVALQTLIGEFVTLESRSQGDAQASAARVKDFVTALDENVAQLERDGQVLLVRESVVGHNLPDRTSELRAMMARTSKVDNAAR